MRRLPVILLAACLLLRSVPASAAPADPAQAARDADIAQRALKGQELIFARDYDKANQIFDALIKDYPDSAAGYFGTMALYEVRMLEGENFAEQGDFRKAAKRGLAVAGKIQQRYNPTSWQLFLCGSLLGLDAFFKARKSEWWDAYTEGTKSRQLFRHVKELDPGFVDADFGLGMYLYWRSVFTRDLWFLRIFPDRRAEAIAIVERVARQGRFAKELAKINLGIIYFEEGRFGDAEAIFADFVKRFPQNVILRRLYGKVLLAQKKYDAGIEQFRTILTITPKGKKAHYFIGAALVLKKDSKRYEEAEQELKTFLKLQGGRYWPAATHYWLGRLAEQRGDAKRAKQERAKAKKLYPDIEEVMERPRGMGGGI